MKKSTLWGWMKGTGWDGQMRSFQTIDQVHVPFVDRRRGWNDQMRGNRTFDQVRVLSGMG